MKRAYSVASAAAAAAASKPTRLSLHGIDLSTGLPATRLRVSIFVSDAPSTAIDGAIKRTGWHGTAAAAAGAGCGSDLGAALVRWRSLGTFVTDHTGRVQAGELDLQGRYLRLLFDLDEYFANEARSPRGVAAATAAAAAVPGSPAAAAAEAPSFPFADFVIRVKTEEKLHVPLMLTKFGVQSYRGS